MISAHLYKLAQAALDQAPSEGAAFPTLVLVLFRNPKRESTLSERAGRHLIYHPPQEYPSVNERGRKEQPGQVETGIGNGQQNSAVMWADWTHQYENLAVHFRLPSGFEKLLGLVCFAVDVLAVGIGDAPLTPGRTMTGIVSVISAICFLRWAVTAVVHSRGY